MQPINMKLNTPQNFSLKTIRLLVEHLRFGTSIAATGPYVTIEFHCYLVVVWHQSSFPGLKIAFDIIRITVS
ncbi:hypothetical protein NMG60_11032495 [Bertholletia excelsa]